MMLLRHYYYEESNALGIHLASVSEQHRKLDERLSFAQIFTL